MTPLQDHLSGLSRQELAEFIPSLVAANPRSSDPFEHLLVRVFCVGHRSLPVPAPLAGSYPPGSYYAMSAGELDRRLTYLSHSPSASVSQFEILLRRTFLLGQAASLAHSSPSS